MKEQIHQILENIVRTYNLQEKYVDAPEPWMGIISASAFTVQSTYHRTKRKSPVQLVFGRDIILPINHIANWRHICQRKQKYIEKDLISEKFTRIDYDLNIGDKVTVRKKHAYNKNKPVSRFI